MSKRIIFDTLVTEAIRQNGLALWLSRWPGSLTAVLQWPVNLIE